MLVLTHALSRSSICLCAQDSVHGVCTRRVPSNRKKSAIRGGQCRSIRCERHRQPIDDAGSLSTPAHIGLFTAHRVVHSPSACHRTFAVSRRDCSHDQTSARSYLREVTSPRDGRTQSVFTPRLASLGLDTRPLDASRVPQLAAARALSCRGPPWSCVGGWVRVAVSSSQSARAAAPHRSACVASSAPTARMVATDAAHCCWSPRHACQAGRRGRMKSTRSRHRGPRARRPSPRPRPLG